MTCDRAEAVRQIMEQPTVPVAIACIALGISDWAGYASIKRGDFPVPTISVGHRTVVVTAPLRQALCLEET